MTDHKEAANRVQEYLAAAAAQPAQAAPQAEAPDPRPLFDRKLENLKDRGYEVIGRILHKDGQYALFDSSCRWLTQPQYWRLMHEQDNSLFAAPAQAAPQAEAVCTCPSGDGSLCWPCPTHPPVAQGAVPKVLTHDQIREAGGIVHKDGNIFFTNLDKLNKAIALAKPEIMTDGPSGWRSLFQEFAAMSQSSSVAAEAGNENTGGKNG